MDGDGGAVYPFVGMYRPDYKRSLEQQRRRRFQPAVPMTAESGRTAPCAPLVRLDFGGQ